MASTRVDKYKEKRDSIDKMNEEVTPKKKVAKQPVTAKEGSKEKILEELGIDTSFGLEEKAKPSILQNLNKNQDEVYKTQEMKIITDADIKQEGSVSHIMDIMKQDLPLNESVTSIKPAKRTQISPEFISAKEKYSKKEEKKEEVVEAKPKQKLIINDNTKKVKNMPKTSATKVMGIDDILEVKAKQNANKKNTVTKKAPRKKLMSDTMLLAACLGMLVIAVVVIVIVLFF